MIDIELTSRRSKKQERAAAKLQEKKDRVARREQERAIAAARRYFTDFYYASDEWAHLRQTILDRDGGMCVSCGQPAVIVSQLRPMSMGGISEESNLVSSCSDCGRKSRGHAFNSAEERRELISAMADTMIRTDSP
jgi:5-methylcytosine-specific restriction endonuclease McrA